MASRDRSKILNSDKEVNAFKSNMKEQRCLSKSLSILDAEASYSVKLLELDCRSIRTFYKRFRNKVTKIKSKLSTEQISDFKDMEERGILKLPTTPVNLSGALRIADATKRLKLNHQERKSNNARKAISAHDLHRRNSSLHGSSIDLGGSMRAARRPSTSAPPSVDSKLNTPLVSRQNSICPFSPRGKFNAGRTFQMNCFAHLVQNVESAEITIIYEVAADSSLFPNLPYRTI